MMWRTCLFKLCPGKTSVTPVEFLIGFMFEVERILIPGVEARNSFPRTEKEASLDEFNLCYCLNWIQILLVGVKLRRRC